jgi:hypothetical protein
VSERTTVSQGLCEATAGPAESNVPPLRTSIPIADLKTGVATQVRVKSSDAVIDDYVEKLTGGIDLGPVVVFHDRAANVYWLADGYHRTRAAERVGRAAVDALVYDGSERDAFLFAAAANTRHGLVAGRDDRKKVARLMLADPEWGQWSNKEIARRTGLSDKTVAKERRALSAESPRMRKVGRSRTVYTMDTLGLTSRKGRDQGAVTQPVVDDRHEPDPTPRPLPTTETTHSVAEPEPVVGTSEPTPAPPPAVPMTRDWATDPLDLGYLLDSGLLDELNRKILHTFGIGLAVRTSLDGTRAVAFEDRRADPPALTYDPDTLAANHRKLAQFLDAFGHRQARRRREALGWVCQPLGPKSPAPPTGTSADAGGGSPAVPNPGLAVGR